MPDLLEQPEAPEQQEDQLAKLGYSGEGDPLASMGYSQPGPQGEDFANPQSVNLQPPQPPQPAEEAVFGGGVGKNVDAHQQAGYTPEGIAPVPGTPTILDPIAAHQASENRPGKDGTLQHLRDSFGKARKGIQEQREELKKAATNKIKKEIKKRIRQVVVDFLIETFPAWGPVVGVILLIVALIVGLAVGIALLQKGNTPPSSYTIGVGSQFAKTSSNPDGTYLRMMTPTLGLKDEHGITQMLSVESTAGGWVEENESKIINGCPRWVVKTADCLAFSQKYDQNTKKLTPITDADLKYYLNMRWPYMHDVDWPTSSHKVKGAIKGYAPAQYYGGAKVMVYNPKTKKAVVGLIAEWGPEPAFDVCQNAGRGANGTQTETRNPRNSATACHDEGAEWGAISRKGINGNFRPPADYTGAIVGLAPSLKALLGTIDDHQVVFVGFAKDQSLSPGTVVPVSDADIIHVSDLATTVASTGALKVPGVEEGVHSECGVASINMVALYYASNKGSNHLTYDQLPAAMKDYLISAKPISPNAWFSTERSVDTGCVTPTYLNTMKAGVPTDWTTVSIGNSEQEKLRAAIRSVQAGDPVVFYSYNAIYKGPHIFVLVGYNNATGEFIVNNPYPSGVDVGMTGGQLPGGTLKQPLTLDFLFQHRGDTGDYGHSLIIRSTYLK